MTRTHGAASSGLREAGATSQSTASSRAWRRLSVVPIALLLAAVMLMPQSAIAAESTSGYSQTVPTPKTTPTTPSTPSTTPSTPSQTPSTGTSPSKEEKEKAEKTSPSKETSPSSTSPTSATSAAKSLPFTGMDLRLVLGGGLLLTGAGFSLLLLDGRLRRRAGR